MLNICTDWLCVVLAAREAFKKNLTKCLYFSDSGLMMMGQGNTLGMLGEEGFQGASRMHCDSSVVNDMRSL